MGSGAARVGGADPGARGGRTRGTLKRRTGCTGSAQRCAARPIPPHPRRPPPSALDSNPFKIKNFSDLRQPMTAPHPVTVASLFVQISYCIRNNFCQSSNLAVQNGFISRGSSGLPQLFRVAELRGGPSTSFGVFATLSLYRYSLLCTYCTNSRRRFDSARRDRAENCNCSCGEGCGGRAVAARRARRSRDTANVRNVPTRMRLCCLYIASQL
jgi:hypothetical protein